MSGLALVPVMVNSGGGYKRQWRSTHLSAHTPGRRQLAAPTRCHQQLPTGWGLGKVRSTCPSAFVQFRPRPVSPLRLLVKTPERLRAGRKSLWCSNAYATGAAIGQRTSSLETCWWRTFPPPVRRCVSLPRFDSFYSYEHQGPVQAQPLESLRPPNRTRAWDQVFMAVGPPRGPRSAVRRINMVVEAISMRVRVDTAGSLRGSIKAIKASEANLIKVAPWMIAGWFCCARPLSVARAGARRRMKPSLAMLEHQARPPQQPSPWLL